MHLSHFRTRAATAVAILPLLLVPLLAAPLAAQDDTAGTDALSGIDRAARQDLGGPPSGIAALVVHDGELDFAAAWGTPAAGSDEELTVEHLVPWRDFSEILLAATIRALHDAGQIDAFRPLGQFVNGLPTWLRPITFDQLLTHRAGFHDDPPVAGVDRTNLLEAQGDLTFVAPGQLYSRSRWSYPVAAHILERLVGGNFPQIARAALIAPLGMARTTFDRESAAQGGLATGIPAGELDAGDWQLPVVYTAATDVAQFLVAWTGGAVRGAEPTRWAPESTDGRPVFVDGVWTTDMLGFPRIWRTSAEGGFSVQVEAYPETATATVIWANGGSPARVSSSIASSVGFALGTLGMAGMTPQAPPALDEEWAGRWTNGSRSLELQVGDGGATLVLDGATMPLRAIGDGTFLVGPNSNPGTLRPARIDGRPVLHFGGIAWLPEDGGTVRR